jgi:hypothetical protein
MELEFELTEEDIIALAEYQSKRSPAFIRQQQIRRFGYLIGFTILAIGMWLLTQQIILPAVSLGLAILLFLFYPQFQKWQLRRKVHQAYQQEKYQATLASRTLKATDEGLEEVSPFGEIKVKWDVVDEIQELPAHCLISIQQFPSVVIPKNRIDPKIYEEFVQICRKHRPDTLSKLLEVKRKHVQ